MAKHSGSLCLFRSPWLGSLDVGLQKSVTSKFQVKLSAQDVFHTNRFIRTIDAPNFKSSGNLAFDTRVVMLTLTYSFGNQQLRERGNEKLVPKLKHNGQTNWFGPDSRSILGIIVLAFIPEILLDLPNVKMVLVFGRNRYLP